MLDWLYDHPFVAMGLLLAVLVVLIVFAPRPMP